MHVHVVTIEYTLEKTEPRLGDTVLSPLLHRADGRCPVLHLFGYTFIAGVQHSVCVHVHGVYPYFFVPRSSSRVSAAQFGAQLESITAQQLQLSGVDARIIHDVSVVEGTPFYGYFGDGGGVGGEGAARGVAVKGLPAVSGRRPFFKVAYTNPALRQPLADLLGSTQSVGGQRWQPYEAHAAYHAQFMIDHNVRGMAPLIVNGASIRQPMPTALRAPEALRAHGLALLDGDTGLPAPRKEKGAARCSGSSADETDTVGHTGTFPRETTADIELDVRGDQLRSVAEPGGNVNEARRQVRRYFKRHPHVDHAELTRATVDPAETRLVSVGMLQRSDAAVAEMRNTMSAYLEARNGDSGKEGNGAMDAIHSHVAPTPATPGAGGGRRSFVLASLRPPPPTQDFSEAEIASGPAANDENSIHHGDENDTEMPTGAANEWSSDAQNGASDSGECLTFQLLGRPDGQEVEEVRRSAWASAFAEFSSSDEQESSCGTVTTTAASSQSRGEESSCAATTDSAEGRGPVEPGHAMTSTGTSDSNGEPCSKRVRTEPLAGSQEGGFTVPRRDLGPGARHCSPASLLSGGSQAAPHMLQLLPSAAVSQSYSGAHRPSVISEEELLASSSLSSSTAPCPSEAVPNAMHSQPPANTGGETKVSAGPTAPGSHDAQPTSSAGALDGELVSSHGGSATAVPSSHCRESAQVTISSDVSVKSVIAIDVDMLQTPVDLRRTPVTHACHAVSKTICTTGVGGDVSRTYRIHIDRARRVIAVRYGTWDRLRVPPYGGATHFRPSCIVPAMLSQSPPPRYQLRGWKRVSSEPPTMFMVAPHQGSSGGSTSYGGSSMLLANVTPARERRDGANLPLSRPNGVAGDGRPLVGPMPRISLALTSQSAAAASVDPPEKSELPPSSTATRADRRLEGLSPRVEQEGQEPKVACAATLTKLAVSQRHHASCSLRIMGLEVLIDRHEGRRNLVHERLLGVAVALSDSDSPGSKVRLYCIEANALDHGCAAKMGHYFSSRVSFRGGGADNVSSEEAHPSKFTFSGSVDVLLCASERQLLLRVRQEVLRYDPDILLSWEGVKFGVGFFALRYQVVLERSFTRDFSRLGRAYDEESDDGGEGDTSPALAPKDEVAVDVLVAELKREIVHEGTVSAPCADKPYTDDVLSGSSAAEELMKPSAGAVTAAVGGDESDDPQEDMQYLREIPWRGHRRHRGHDPRGIAAGQRTERRSQPRDSKQAAIRRYTARFNATFRVPGRIVISLSSTLRKSLPLTSHTLSAVHQALFHTPLPLFSDKALASLYRSGGSQEGFVVLSTLLQRVVVPNRVAHHLNFYNRTAEFARMYGILFVEVLTRGSQFRVEASLMRFAKPCGYVLASPSAEQVSKQPRLQAEPLILQPKSAYYRDDPVLVLDFRSLYPSVMMAYNLCYCTLIGRVERSCVVRLGVFPSYKTPDRLLRNLILDDDESEASCVTVAPNGCLFVKPSVREGILPQMVRCILDARLEVQAALKKIAKPEGDEGMQRVLQEQQLALKLLANVTYGYTATSFTGRMPCCDVADAIILFGRQTLERAIEQINSHPSWGAEVIYGDTDSIFVKVAGRSKEEAFAIGADIARAVTAANPAPITLQFEKVFLPCLLVVKKRYVGYAYTSVNQDTPVFDAKGIETVRRDQCSATRKIVEKMLRELFDHSARGNRAAEVHNTLRRMFFDEVGKLQRGDVNPTECIFRRAVKLGRYSDDAHLPLGARLALRRMEDDAAATPSWGERLPYVIVQSTTSARLRDQVAHPQDLLLGRGVSLDAEYYITRHLVPSLDRMFYMVGISFSRWYGEMPRRSNIRSYFNLDLVGDLPVVNYSAAVTVDQAEESGTGSVKAREEASGQGMPPRDQTCVAPRFGHSNGPAGALRLPSLQHLHFGATHAVADHEGCTRPGERQGGVIDGGLIHATAQPSLEKKAAATGPLASAAPTARRRPPGPQPQKVTLADYYHRQLCAVCRKTSSTLDIPSAREGRWGTEISGGPRYGPPVCNNCLSHLSESAAFVSLQRLRMEKRLQALEIRCLRCIGSAGEFHEHRSSVASAPRPARLATLTHEQLGSDDEALSLESVGSEATLLSDMEDCFVAPNRAPQSQQAVANVPRRVLRPGDAVGCLSFDCTVSYDKKRTSSLLDQLLYLEQYLYFRATEGQLSTGSEMHGACEKLDH